MSHLSIVSRGAIALVAKNMRKADREEIMAASGTDPEDCLMASVAMSDYARAIVVKGVVVAILGLVVGQKSIPWMLGTDDVDRLPKSFWRAVKQAFAEMQSISPRMENYVHAANDKSVRLLKRLGFEMETPVEFGVKGEKFHRFHLGDSHV